MRLMSFNLTQDAYCSGAKDLTRRDGWGKLKDREHFMGVDRVMGFKKGEHPVKIGQSIVVSVKKEPLEDIVKRPFRRIIDPEEWQRYARICPFYNTCCGCQNPKNLGCWCGVSECPGASEVVREGFPAWVGKEEQFVNLYLKASPKGGRSKIINRIQFVRVVA